MENHKYLRLVICHDVFVESRSKRKRKNEEHIQMQFCTANMEYERWPFTKSINLLDVALKFVRAYIGESLSNAYEVSFGSSPGLLGCIKAKACVFTLLITKEMNNNSMKSGTGKPNTDDEVIGSENDLPLDGFLPDKSKMMYSLRNRRLHLSAEEFQEVEIRITDSSQENNSHDGSTPDKSSSRLCTKMRMTDLNEFRKQVF